MSATAISVHLYSLVSPLVVDANQRIQDQTNVAQEVLGGHFGTLGAVIVVVVVLCCVQERT